MRNQRTRSLFALRFDRLALINNIPVSALVNSGARYTIGIQLYKRIGALAAPASGPPEEHLDELEERVGIGLWVDRLRQRFGWEAEPAGPVVPNGLEVVERALDIMMAQLEGYRLQSYRPEVLIVPGVQALGMLSFSHEREGIYQSGVGAAKRKADELEALVRRVAQGVG